MGIKFFLLIFNLKCDNSNSLNNCLINVSEEVFFKSTDNIAYVHSFLLFCIELHKQYRHFHWYSIDILINIVVNILFESTQFTPVENTCCIMYLFMF